MVIVSFIAFLAVSLIFSRLWLGIINASLIESETLESIEKRQPYLPSAKVIFGTISGTIVLFLLSIRGLEGVVPVDSPAAVLTLAVFFATLALVLIAVEQRVKAAREYVFSCMIGSGISIALLNFERALFSGSEGNPFFLTLVVIGVFLSWRFLFGPWSAHVKATVLGTFIFWLGLLMFWSDSPDVRMARILATAVALVPAGIWCGFFLKYHYQRTSLVLLMFFAGMISTAPILFYDKIVRSGIELQFFFFRIVPENFNRTSSVFIAGDLFGITGVRSTLLATLVSFMLVGVIEECSKFWVMRHSGKNFYTSIDDAMQLSIIVAIGFAFAENILNPTYFMSFVREYLMGSSPDWGAFIGNVMGRAILTNMVHIVSTGVIGYFFGLALFARPYIRDKHAAGKVLWVSDGLHAFFGFPRKAVFRMQMIFIGVASGVVLHGMFNFLVTFPDIIPGNPHTLADLFNLSTSSPLHYIPLLMIPSLFYVVGGFWLLTEIFYQKDNMKERGHLITTDSFVTVMS